MEVSTPKNGRKTASFTKRIMHKFSICFWCGYLHQPTKYYNNSLSFYFDVLKADFDFDISVANNVAIDVAQCALPGKMMHAPGSTCPDTVNFFLQILSHELQTP